MAAQAEVGLVLRQLHGLVAEVSEALSDRQLLERFVGTREEGAFAALVRRHGGMVLGLCRRLLGQHQDAEDCFQAAFFILARKAASIRRQVSLGAWLYSVAYRLALKAQAANARRRDRESHGAAMTPADPTTEATSRDLRLLLDEELRRLPDGYRAALVLCYLEGRTQEQAARQLGWSKGTLRRRLIQGRELLRQRLLRRGLAPAVALAATLAGVPAELLASTTRAALGFAVGSPASPASARAAALAEGGRNSIFLGRMKTAAALLLAAGIAVAGLWTCRAGAPADKVADKPQLATKRKPVVAPGPETADMIEVSGRVLDPSGKPVAGARVSCFRSNLFHMAEGGILQGAPHGKPATTTSGPDGRFRMRVRTANHRLPDDERSFEATVAAVAPGHGPGWTWIGRPDGLKDVVLKLVRDDVPIHGRILGLEGKPIKGVTVRVLAVIASDAEDLKPLVESLAKDKDRGKFWWFLRKSLDPALVGLPHTATTDADGRFRLTGLGRERVLSLRFEGPTIETQTEYAMTRPGATLRLNSPKEWPGPADTFVLHGATFERAAAPTRPIVGTVRDRDNGKPIAGAKVSGRSALWRMGSVQTTTDREGRYRLVGLPSGGQHTVSVFAPQGQPYLPATGEANARPGPDPIRLDLGMKRGVRIRGRVTDAATGKPVPARVHYYVFLDNPNLRETPGFRNSGGLSTLTRSDGSFELLGLPGRGLVTAVAVGTPGSRYVAGAGAEKIKGADQRGHFRTAPFIVQILRYNTLVEINPGKGADSVSCKVVLDPGKTVSGMLVGPDGKPVEGVRIEGSWGVAQPEETGLPTARFTLTAVNPANPRPYFFYHGEKKLGAAVVLRGDEPRDFTVRLRPLATLTGRLLDEDGEPMAGARLVGRIEGGQLNLAAGWAGVFNATTDKNGRFRVERLIAGIKWGAYAERKGMFVSRPFEGVSLQPGETRDLGDLPFKAFP